MMMMMMRLIMPVYLCCVLILVDPAKAKKSLPENRSISPLINSGKPSGR